MARRRSIAETGPPAVSGEPGKYPIQDRSVTGHPRPRRAIVARPVWLRRNRRRRQISVAVPKLPGCHGTIPGSRVMALGRSRRLRSQYSCQRNNEHRENCISHCHLLFCLYENRGIASRHPQSPSIECAMATAPGTSRGNQLSPSDAFANYPDGGSASLVSSGWSFFGLINDSLKPDGQFRFGKLCRVGKGALRAMPTTTTRDIIVISFGMPQYRRARISSADC